MRFDSGYKLRVTDGLSKAIFCVCNGRAYCRGFNYPEKANSLTGSLREVMLGCVFFGGNEFRDCGYKTIPRGLPKAIGKFTTH